jgi:hypothetical protein
MRKICIVISTLLIVTASGFGQDLNKLETRAKRLMAASAAGNKVEAATYIEPAKRDSYLAGESLKIVDGHLAGLEFTDDSRVVYATYAVTLMLPEVGRINTSPRVPWIWTGKDWFVRIDGTQRSLFSQNPDPVASAPKPEPVPFELSVKTLDLGRHVQGEFTRQTLEFRSEKNRISLIAQKSDVPGLVVGQPVWTSNEQGKVEITLDTTLLTTDISYKVALQAVGWDQEKTDVQFEIKAQIEPRLRFSQTPPVIDATKTGSAELTIENISNIPLIPVSIISTNREFKIESDVPASIKPGETLKLKVTYDAQPEPAGGMITFQTAQPVLAGKSFAIPLNIKLPEPTIPTNPLISPEEVERLKRSGK